MQTLQEIAEIIKNAKSAVIFTHMRPDGDAIGSAMSLFFALKQLNIPCEVVDESDVPEKFYYFPSVSLIKKRPEINASLYISVDCADEFRLGALSETFLAGKKKIKTVNIDHHVSNTRYADYNFVEDKSANCENMLSLIKYMGVKIDKTIASFLLLGIMTDSGNFSHGDVTSATFAAASELCAAGADPNGINYNIFKKQKKERALLYGNTMVNMRFELDDKLAIIVVNRDDFKKFSAKQEYTEGFVDFPLSVDTVEVAVAFMETRKGQYKCSLRSKGKVNVNAIAGVYGGGGHILASGCMMFGDIEEAIDSMRYTVSQYIDE